MRRLMLDALQGLAAVAVILLALAAVDINDRIVDRSAGMAREDYARWVNESCLPRRADDRAVARIDAEGRLRCVIFAEAGYGRAGRVVSAAVMEAP